MKKFFLNIFVLLIILLILASVGSMVIMVQVRSEYQSKIYNDVDQLPNGSTIVVLGASVHPDNTPSDALEDRLEIAARAWRAEKIENIVLSGDDGTWAQEEIQSMLGYLIDAGVPRDNIIIDGNNARTFDSCYRLKNVLNQNKVVLITQSFHMPRALYLCNEIGLDAWGLESDLRWYKDVLWFTVRDWMASLLAFWDLYNQRLPSYLEVNLVD